MYANEKQQQLRLAHFHSGYINNMIHSFCLFINNGSETFQSDGADIIDKCLINAFGETKLSISTFASHPLSQKLKNVLHGLILLFLSHFPIEYSLS